LIDDFLQDFFLFFEDGSVISAMWDGLGSTVVSQRAVGRLAIIDPTDVAGLIDVSNFHDIVERGGLS
jgi:hypothetical protein